MAHGHVQNKIPHYAGPNLELKRSPQAPAGAQKCHFLPGFAKMHFLAYITRGPLKNKIYSKNGIGNVFEVSKLAKTAVTMSGWESRCIAHPDAVTVVTTHFGCL